jgi:hypothetical protein
VPNSLGGVGSLGIVRGSVERCLWTERRGGVIDSWGIAGTSDMRVVAVVGVNGMEVTVGEEGIEDDPPNCEGDEPFNGVVGLSRE